MYKDRYPWIRFIKDYWILLEGRRFWFVFFTILRSIASLAPFGMAYSLGRIVDFFTKYNTGESLTEFYVFVVIIAALGYVHVWLRFFSKVRMQDIGAKIRREVRIEAMSKLMELELKWHEKEETGSKIQKINLGGEHIFETMHLFSNDGINILTGIFGSLIIFLALDWGYWIFASLYTIIFLISLGYFNRKVNYWQDRLNKIREKVSGKLHESASNVLTIKSLGLKDVFRKSTTSYENQYYKMWLGKRKAVQTKTKVVKVFAALGYAGFILMIGFDVISGLITVGLILTFASYFNSLGNALNVISDRSSEFIKTKSAVGRFMTIFGIETFGKEKGLSNISKNWKKLEFIDVCFKYKDRIIFNNFNLVINRGDKIGIVGKTGCGKSTLAKLLLGLYQIQKGQILIDGKSLSRYKHKSITNTIAIVLQESEMFNMSLLNNVIISSAKKDIKAFRQATKIAQLEILIKKMPNGLNTLIGERGYKLSGGERQRIGIARALYKDPSILILDEATSSLDSRTENLIQNSLDKNLKDKTMLVIAHRLSTLRDVDRIIVIDKGRIIESGSFKKLVKNKGLFYQLYELQRKQMK